MGNPLRDLIERRMKELGMRSVRELGERSGIAHTTIKGYTRDVNPQMPRPSSIEGLASALQVSYREIYDAALRAIGAKTVFQAAREVGVDRKFYLAVEGAGFADASQEELEHVAELVEHVLREEAYGRATGVDIEGAERDPRHSRRRASGRAGRDRVDPKRGTQGR